MTVRDLVEILSNYPGSANVGLGRVIALTPEQSEELPSIPPGVDVVLDFPIIGIAYDGDANDIRLVVENDKAIEAFGKIQRLDRPLIPETFEPH